MRTVVQKQSQPDEKESSRAARIPGVSSQFPFGIASSKALASPGFRYGFTRASLNTPQFKGKLAINEPGDPFEREADSVAERVMRMPDPRRIQQPWNPVAIPNQLQRKCAGCEDEEEKHWLHRKETGIGPTVPPPIVYQVLNAPGQPLDPATRDFMEPRFGHDFSRVRVHNDAQAAESARSVNARAYTVGQNVVFGENQYTPGSSCGLNLLAHELTHVVQQGRSAPSYFDRQGQASVSPALHVASQAKLQRQGEDLGVRLNASLSRSDLEGAVRALMEMSDSDARAALSALNSDTRARLRTVALRLDPSPGNRVAQLVDSVESVAGREQPVPVPGPAAPQSGIASLSATDKLGRAWNYARQQMAAEAQRALQDLFSPASLAIMAGFIVAYVAAQLTPVGWVADAIALASLSVAAIFMGRLLFDILEDLYTFFSAVNATTEEQLREAGRALARAIARGGVQIVVLLLTRGMRGGRGRGSPPPRTPPPSAGAEMVTPDGLVVRVPPEAVPELPSGPRFSSEGPVALRRGPISEPEIPVRPAPPPARPAPEAPARPPLAEPPSAGPPRPGTVPREGAARPQLGEGRMPDILPRPVPVPPRRRGESGSMRHQIQRGDNHYASFSVTATGDLGVTALQLRNTMAANLNQYMEIAQGSRPAPRGWTRGPVGWERPIRSAIIRQSQAITPIVAAGGVTQGGDINALRQCFDPATNAPSDCASNDVRLDVENRGHNLRE